MKKYLFAMFVVLFCLLCTLCAACAAPNTLPSGNNTPPGENAALQNESDTPPGESDTSPSESGSPPAEAEQPAPGESVDVDLSALSSTMIFAEMINMTSNPDDYFGKTVKTLGKYYTGYSESTGLPYHYVMVSDAAACCQQGMEFKWNGDHAFPEDYPETNAKVEVCGVFGSYKVGEYTRYYLAVDDISILK